MIKKLLILIICFCLQLQIIPVYGEADDAEFTEEKRVLSEIGLWNDDYQDSISREVFSKVVISLFMPNSLVSQNNITYYADVLPENEYAPYINLAAEMGYMLGTDEKKFSPKDNVTVEQAAIILMRGFGYSHAAEYCGGYPNGYLSQSVADTILKGIRSRINEGLSADVLAKLIYNCMEVPIAEINIGKGDSFSYKYDSEDADTILSLRDLYIEKGIVNADSNTTLVSADEVVDGVAQVDYIKYFEGNSDISDYLGYKIEFIYKEAKDDSMGTVMCVYNSEKYNKTVTLNASDIEKFIFAERKYIYRTDKQSRVSFEKNSDIIFNGKSTAITEDDFIPSSGNVVLIDNNSDGKYEIVNIKSYTQTFVERVDSSQGMIFDEKYALNNIDLHTDESDYKYILRDKDGVKRKLFELNSKDVVSAAVSKDKKYIELIYCSNSIKGKISKVSSTDNEVTIDNSVYKLSQRISSSEIRSGDIVTAYLDFENHIAAVEKDIVSSTVFGYLVDMRIDDDFENTLLKIYTQEGNFETIVADESIKIDGVSYKNSNYDRIQSAIITGGSINQIIRYKKNAENKIVSIDTLKTTSSERTDENLQKVPYLNIKPQGGTESGVTGAMTYYKSARSFSYRVYLRETTKLFYIPYADLSDKTQYKVISVDSLSDGYDNIIEAYNVDGDNRFADVVVMEQKIGNITYSNSAHFGVIKKIVETVLDDEIIKRAEVITQSGQEFVYLKNASDSSPDFIINDKVCGKSLSTSTVSSSVVEINAGDTVRYMVEDGGYVYGMQIVLDADTRKFYNPTSNSAFATKLRVTGGKVQDFSDNIISVSNADVYNQLFGGVSPMEYYPYGKCNVITVDMNTSKTEVSSGTISDIKDYKSYGSGGSWIVYYTKDKSPQIIIIYNNLDKNPNIYLTQEAGFTEYTDAKPYIGFVYPY